MKPEWDKLMAEYEGSDSLLIADVDCTAGGKDLCEDVGVRGYPTIKHGDPDDLQDYQGGRTFEQLKTFAEGLKPHCSPTNLDLCDDDKKKLIEELMALSKAERAERIQEKEGAITKLEADFKAFVEGLNKQYQEEDAKKDKAIEDIKASGLGLLKSVQKVVLAKSEL